MLWILTKKIWFPVITPKVKYNNYQVFSCLDIWIENWLILGILIIEKCKHLK